MREKKDNQAREVSVKRKHPIIQQLLAVLLGFCLAVVSIPMSQCYSVQAAQFREDVSRLSGLSEESGERPRALGLGDMGGEPDGPEMSRRNLPQEVTPDDGVGSRPKESLGEESQDFRQRKMTEEQTELLFADDGGEDLPETPSQPGCGIILEDTVWEAAGELKDGELIVQPGVTLTINSTIAVSGTVTIKGGGVIARGNSAGGFRMSTGARLTLQDITLDGCSDTIPGFAVPMISLWYQNELTLDDGCTIRNSRADRGAAVCLRGGSNKIILNRAVIENCSASINGGGIFANSSNVKIVLNNAVIRGCSASDKAGGIYATYADVTINGGRYENNRTTNAGSLDMGITGGGFIFICMATLTINDGIFTGNTSVTKGGCIHHCGHENTRTYINGGVFSGNSCSNETYAGSGAVYNSTAVEGNTSVTLSGDVKFGDGVSETGVDGVYLDATNVTLRKIQLSDTLTYPVTLYLKPQENYVIAQGINDYQLLRERDMKKIHFVDTTDSDKTWYAVLDKEKNQVYLSTTNPGYGYFVYYIKNGAKGTAVTDDYEYQLQEEVTVKSADGLTYEGRQFVGWNTEADGSGTMYREGDTFALQGDTDLYAIFEESFAADFYSGSAGNKETVAAEMDWEQITGHLSAPELKPLQSLELPEGQKLTEEWEMSEERGSLEGFEAVGWDESEDGFVGEIQAGDEIVLTGNEAFYGVYKKDVTLSYDANGGESCPERETKLLHVNVSEQLAYDVPTFTVSGKAVKKGSIFAGWNTEADGSGTMYQEGDTLELEEDEILYAMYGEQDRPPYVADFYSGSAGNKETKLAIMDWEQEIGMLTAPELQPLQSLELPEGQQSLEGQELSERQEGLEGFKAVGWDESEDGFAGEIQAGDEVVLTEDDVYYGVYGKEVTLSYDANGGEQCPENATKTLHVNVSEQLAYDIPTFTVAGEAAKQGCVFAGWNTEADGSGTMYQEGDTLNLEADEVLYAIFTDKEVFVADFYSGSAGKKEKKAAEMDWDQNVGLLTAPELKPLEIPEQRKERGLLKVVGNSEEQVTPEGFAAVGWEERPDMFGGGVKPGAQLSLSANAVYYGVYGKNVTLSYDANGGGRCPESETETFHINVSERLSYDIPTFTAAEPVGRTGYVFAGWNTKADGTGEPVNAGQSLELCQDTVLYAMWVDGNATPYRVEHYKQDLEGDGYTRADADTEYLAGKTNAVVKAEANAYAGFCENTESGLGKASGVVEADGSLVLQLYYDRKVYEVDYDLNGGEGVAPKTENVRYGGLLQEPEEPRRRGYTFLGWYLDKAGTEAAYWDFYQTVEQNTEEPKATLYAKWVDDIAPVLGEASFGAGSRNFTDWIVGRKKLTITVPLMEEGSGLKQGDYRLLPEEGREKAGTALIRVQQAVTPEIRGRSGGVSAVMTICGNAESGDSAAVITIAADFKGSVSLTCMDNAGNISVEKMLTADGAGAVVEDNAPRISCSEAKKEAGKPVATVKVNVEDDVRDNISAGLAAISYRIDEGTAKAVGKGEFDDSMVESYSFPIHIRGEGKHTLQVTATDNAGNESTKEVAVEISKKAVVTPKPEPPAETPRAGGEPKTGENTFVKVFATLGMVAGFSYLLLYFNSGEGGITEGEKEEIVSRLVRWARKGKLRKYPALLLISVFLVYYHSIGRSVNDEWRKMCEG